MPTETVGPLLKEWRVRRHRSQMDLALDVGVSTRHLSFVETGRSRPSAELVLDLAEGLEMPLRDRNTLLLAAGYAPRYSESTLDSPEMARSLTAIQRILDAHDPYPGVVMNRCWNVVGSNTSAAALVAMLPAHLQGPPLNLMRASLHPDGFARMTRNIDAWGGYLRSELDRAVATTADPGIIALADEIREYPSVVGLASPGADDDPGVVLSIELVTPSGPLSMFTMLTRFPSARDVTLDELMIELYYPADQASEAMLRKGHQRP